MDIMSTMQGWECPKCGRVYSPSTCMCFYCGPNATPATTTFTTNVAWNLITTDIHKSEKSCPSCGKFQWELGLAHCPDGFHYVA